MELVLLITVVIAFLFILWRLSTRMQLLHRRFDHLHQELREIRQLLGKLQAPSSQAEEQPDVPIALPLPLAAEKKTAAEKAALAPPSAPAPGLITRFLRNNPDLEKFIGENLINKIGIAILVLGIGYFVKYAIDQDWINEMGRVGIGLLAGSLLLGLAHRMRHALPAFSSVLVGGGLAVLYFTIAIAFHQYRLFPQTVAFLIMVAITAFSILLSVSYNRVALAVLSLLGGFATPFMVSTGAGNYQVLFVYILILNGGMLVLAYLRNWRIVNWIAYLFTVLLYGGWLSRHVLGVVPAPLSGALAFGTLFYLIFFLMNIINNIREKARFTSPDIAILLSNTFLYYTAGMLVLAPIQKGLFQGLFTVVLAVFNFIFAYALFRNQRADRNLIYLLIGLVITFAILAIPVQLEGNYITLFWALEALLLLWLYHRSGLKLIFLSSLVVQALLVVSLLMDWYHLYLTGGKALPPILNKAFITSAVSLLALTGSIRLLKTMNGLVAFRYLQIEVSQYRQLASRLLPLLLYLALALELHYQLNAAVSLPLNRTIITGTYNLAFLLAYQLFCRQQRPFTAILLGLAGIMAYVIVFSPAVLQLLKARFLQGEPSGLGFAFHYVSLLLVSLLLAFLYQSLRRAPLRPAFNRVLLVSLCFAVVFIASAELLFHVIYLNLPPDTATAARPTEAQFTTLIRQTNKVGFPILWGLCAFVFMLAGLRQKNKRLRIIALSLFTITLLKLFIYDIRDIPEGGKIAAFISLGILLLVISFMYQNLKRLILTDEPAPKADQ